MDEKKKAELELLLKLFEHPGWGLYVREAREKVEIMEKSALGALRTEQDLYYAKGMYAALQNIVNLQDQVENALAHGADEETFEDEDFI